MDFLIVLSLVQALILVLKNKRKNIIIIHEIVVKVLILSVQQLYNQQEFGIFIAYKLFINHFCLGIFMVICCQWSTEYDQLLFHSTSVT